MVGWLTLPWASKSASMAASGRPVQPQVVIGSRLRPLPCFGSLSTGSLVEVGGDAFWGEFDDGWPEGVVKRIRRPVVEWAGRFCGMAPGRRRSVSLRGVSWVRLLAASLFIVAAPMGGLTWVVAVGRVPVSWLLAAPEAGLSPR